MKHLFRWSYRIAIFILPLAAINWIYQVTLRPEELVSLIANRSYKQPTTTWEAYRSLFEEHATEVMTPEFLAGMVQVESKGDRFAVAHWRWRWTTDITRIYAPSSSATGLLQYTQSTFQEAKRFCVHNGKVAYADSGYSLDSCWFNRFYTRFSPSNSIEMTAGRLQHYVDLIAPKGADGNPSLEDRQKLAALIHLCGVAKGKVFAKEGFRFEAVPRCGSHSTELYYVGIRKHQLKFLKVG